MDVRSSSVVGGRSELRSCTCKSRDGRPGLSVPNKPYDFLGRKAKHHDRRSWTLLIFVDVVSMFSQHVDVDRKKHRKGAMSLT